jgi:hypothetical protein
MGKASARALRESSDWREALLRFRDEAGLNWRAFDLVPDDWTCLPYPADFEEAAYAAATHAAYCTTFEEWDIVVTGGRGRPKKVPSFTPEHDDTSAHRYLKHAFRHRWLEPRLGFDKDSGRWEYRSANHHALSLDEVVGEDDQGGEITRGELLESRSMDGADPALVFYAEHPEFRSVFELFERLQGWLPGRPGVTRARGIIL